MDYGEWWCPLDQIFVFSEYFPSKLGILTAYSSQFTGAQYRLSKNFVSRAIKPIPLLFDHPMYYTEFTFSVRRLHQKYMKFTKWKKNWTLAILYLIAGFLWIFFSSETVEKWRGQWTLYNKPQSLSYVSCKFQFSTNVFIISPAFMLRGIYFRHSICPFVCSFVHMFVYTSFCHISRI